MMSDLLDRRKSAGAKLLGRCVTISSGGPLKFWSTATLNVNGELPKQWQLYVDKLEQRITELEAALRECREAVQYTGSQESVTLIVNNALGGDDE